MCVSQVDAHQGLLKQLEQHGLRQVSAQEQLTQHRNGMREEKERSQEFKTSTMNQFASVKDELNQLRARCKAQVISVHSSGNDTRVMNYDG